jgi:septum formation protein
VSLFTQPFVSGASQLPASAREVIVIKTSAGSSARDRIIAAHPITESTIHRGVTIVLGSASPRRREILEQLGISHIIIAPAIDETPRPNEPVVAYLERMAKEKLADVQARAPGKVVLTADTSVIVDGTILGKPDDDRHAREMIARLSGRNHEVTTAFAIQSGETLHVEHVTTRVTFRALDPDEIDRYVASGEGRDKAGAYAVQGLGAMLVSRIEGSYTNVVGLPACEVWMALRALGEI